MGAPAGVFEIKRVDLKPLDDDAGRTVRRLLPHPAVVIGFSPCYIPPHVNDESPQPALCVWPRLCNTTAASADRSNWKGLRSQAGREPLCIFDRVPVEAQSLQTDR